MTDNFFFNVLKSFKLEICEYLKLNENSADLLLDNLEVKEELSGCNNYICLLGFYNSRDNRYGSFCLKHCLSTEKELQLKKEVHVLRLLNSHNFKCPRVIGYKSSIDRFTPCILMECVSGLSLNKIKLSLTQVHLVIDKIVEHQLIIRNNLITLSSFISEDDFGEYIDYELKIKKYLENSNTGFGICNSLGFLNKYLNNKKVIDERVVVTDRSAENIILNDCEEIAFIDFSTLRIGTKFDNIIQFIDDPRISLPIDKELLVKKLFTKFGFSEIEIKYYYAASVYTNLLQGIFTHNKNPDIANDYIKNANIAFESLVNKKSVLIGINL